MVILNWLANKYLRFVWMLNTSPFCFFFSTLHCRDELFNGLWESLRLHYISNLWSITIAANINSRYQYLSIFWLIYYIPFILSYSHYRASFIKCTLESILVWSTSFNSLNSFSTVVWVNQLGTWFDLTGLQPIFYLDLTSHIPIWPTGYNWP